MMNVKLIVSLFIFVSIGVPVLAQKKDAEFSENYLDFGGAFGAFIPYSKNNGLKSKVGSNAITYLQYNFKKNFFARLMLGQTTVEYRSTDQFSNVSASTDSKVNATNIGLDFGYQKRFNKLQPFVYLGLGVSLIEKPEISFMKDNNRVSYKTNSSSQFFLNAGLGVNYIISKNFIIFGEIQTMTVPNIPSRSLTHLSGVSPILGIKALL